jgi:hypothetical protein
LRNIFLFAILVSACSPVVPQGQYGAYVQGHEKHLQLPDGQSLIIYRVKYWTFSSGEPPAIQFEYEALDPLVDTAALRRRAIDLWPAFGAYAESAGLRDGIITATKLKRSGIPGLWGATMNHFGLLVYRGTDGTWRFKDTGGSLPAPEFKRGPQIIEPDGSIMPFASKPLSLVP